MRDNAGEYLTHRKEAMQQAMASMKKVELEENDFIEEYVQINDIQQYFLHYPAEDSDTVVLFVHGGPGYAIGYYAYKFKNKNKAFNCVFYDQRGAGKTQLLNNSKPEDVDFEKLIGDLYETVKYIRKKYAGKKLILLGHSWGSLLGIEYVRRYQETVDAYIGCGQVIDFKAQEARSKKHLYNTILKNGKADELEAFKDVLNYPYDLTDETGMQEIILFRNLQDKCQEGGYLDCNGDVTEPWLLNSPTFTEGCMDVLLNYLYVNSDLIGVVLAKYSIADFKDYKIPMYFIQGSLDFATETSYVKEYFDAINPPDKKFYLYDGIGHLSFLEDPDHYNESMEEICDRVRNVYSKQ